VFICAGATAAYLRKHLARPVLTMRVGGDDLLRALGQAREHASQVALLSYNRIDQGLKAMAALFRCRFTRPPTPPWKKRAKRSNRPPGWGVAASSVPRQWWNWPNRQACTACFH
jgi:hypothetical protein